MPKTWTTPEISVDCPDDKKFAVVDRVKESFKGKYQIIGIDGARILMPGGWGLVRASNTQPVRVLRFEADSEKRLEKIRQEVFKVVEQII